MSDCHRRSDFFIVSLSAGLPCRFLLESLMSLDHKEHEGHEEFFILSILPFVRFVSFVVRFSFLRVLAAAPDDGVDQRRLAGFDLGDGAFHCRADFGRIFDRAFGVPAQSLWRCARNRAAGLRDPCLYRRAPDRCRVGAPCGSGAPSRCSRRGCCTSTISIGMSYLTGIQSAPRSNIKSPSGCRSITSFPEPLCARATPIDMPICVPVPSSRPTWR